MEEYPGCVTALHRLTHPIELLPPRRFLDREHGSFKTVSFDRVVSGLPAYDARSSFLSLPVEIIDHIVRYISTDALSHLSLVSRHCLQLARSLRFADFWLDYSPRSHALLAKLGQEAIHRKNDSTHLPSLSLGVCVRRLYVCTFVEYMEERHHVDLRNRFPMGEEAGRLKAANDAYYNEYLPAIEWALMHALPNLDAISWEDMASLPRSCVVALTRSPIKRLTLRRIQMVENLFDSPISHPPGNGMVLRYLNLDWIMLEPVATALCCNLLHMAAETLEELKLQSTTVCIDSKISPQSGLSLKAHLSPRFPKLRTLRITKTAFSSSKDLTALLGVRDQTKVVTLDMDLSLGQPHARDMIRYRGSIPSMKVLVWRTPHILVSRNRDTIRSFELSFELLRSNCQIEKLSLPHETSTDILTQILLPMLITSFARLSSLDLCFLETSINHEALEMISKLRQLNQLRLSAGLSYGHHNRWRPEHSTIQYHLQGMPNLRRLAFQRDHYSPGSGLQGNHVDDYYNNELVIAESEEEARLYSLARDELDQAPHLGLELRPSMYEEHLGFQRVHMHRMLADARLYAQHLPALQWLYIGRRCFTFTLNGSSMPNINIKSDKQLSPYDLRMFTENTVEDG